MLRLLATVVTTACLVTSAAAQAQTAPTQPSPPAAVKPPAKKPAQKAKTSAKPPAVVESGPCDTGVISAIGDTFAVQKIGITVFGNELTEVPVSWGFDDLLYERAKAIGGNRVRRISYSKGAFDLYYHPKSILLRADNEKLENLVREIAGSSGCDRYLVVTRLDSVWNGTNQTITGMGVMNTGSKLFSQTMVFGSITMRMLDGQTFEMRRDTNVSFKRVLSALVPDDERGPLVVDNAVYPAVATDAANSTVLRDDARLVLTRTADRWLRSYFVAEPQ